MEGVRSKSDGASTSSRVAPKAEKRRPKTQKDGGTSEEEATCSECVKDQLGTKGYRCTHGAESLAADPREKQCPHCKYRTVRPGDLSRHLASVHFGKRPHKCPHCDYRAAQSGTLKKHVDAVHLGEKPYQCPHCDFRAARSGVLKKHVSAWHSAKSPE